MDRGIRDMAQAPRATGKTQVIACVVLTLAAYCVFAGRELRAHRMDPSFFVCAGDRVVNAAALPSPTIVRRDSNGFDGTYFYRIALDPFSNRRVEHGIPLDYPVYRSRRIGYPLAVWLTSWGRPRQAQWMMLAINLAALGVLAAVGAAYARELEGKPWQGLFFSFYPGFLLTLSRDTSEIFALAALAGAFLLLRRGKTAWAVCCLTLAGLTRETALWACAGLMAEGALALARRRGLGQRESSLARRWGASWLGWGASGAGGDGATDGANGRAPTPSWLVWAIPIGVYVAWVASVCLRWRATPFSGAAHNFTPPLTGMVRFVADQLSLLGHPKARMKLLQAAYVAAFLIAAARALPRSRALLREKVAFLVYATIPLCASQIVWADNWGRLRVFAEFQFMGTVVLLGSKSRVKWLIFAWMFWSWHDVFTWNF